MHKDMKNFPQLFTERLKLGKIQRKNITQIVQNANNRNISDNTLNLPFPYKEHDAKFWIKMHK